LGAVPTGLELRRLVLGDPIALPLLELHLAFDVAELTQALAECVDRRPTWRANRSR
jgi:hypothetical protein